MSWALLAVGGPQWLAAGMMGVPASYWVSMDSRMIVYRATVKVMESCDDVRIKCMLIEELRRQADIIISKLTPNPEYKDALPMSHHFHPRVVKGWADGDPLTDAMQGKWKSDAYFL